MNIIDITLIVSGIFLIPIFLVVLIKNPKNSLYLSFALFILNVFIWAFAIAFFRMAKNQESALFWDRIIYIAGTIVPSVIFYLANILVKKKPPHLLIQIIEIVLSFVFLFLLLRTNLWINKIILNDEGNSVILGPIYLLWGIYLAIVYNAGLVILYKGFLAVKGFDRIQIKYILFAIMLPMIVGIVPNVILPYLGNYKYIYIGPMANFGMTLIMTYAILKHRLMNINYLIARSISYTLLVFILGAFYSGGLIVVSSTFIKVQAAPENLIILTTMTLIVAYTFQPLRIFLEKITDKIFYKGHYDSQELLGKFSQVMASTLTISDLTYKLLEVINKQMRISRSFFAVIRNKKLYIAESTHKGNRLHINQKQVEILQSEDRAILKDDIPEGKTKKFMQDNNISLILPLRTKEHYIGLLLLGDKSSGDIYYNQDIDVLEIAGPELAVALQNSQRFEEISQFNIILQQKVKEATIDLQNANEKLKKLDKIKDEFVYLASHELRTPLSSVKSYLWTIIDKFKGPAKTAEDLQIAYASTQKAIDLVNDMLDVSKIESGRIEIHQEKINLAELAQEVKKELLKKAEEKGLSIKVAEGEFKVTSDKDKVCQIMTNLVGNAIKFTKKGGVSITFKDLGKEIETSIADTGIGIKKEDFSTLFTKFGRTDSSYTGISESPGTGLGLYISKKLLEVLHGSISVSSVYKKGTTFRFTLPKSS